MLLLRSSTLICLMILSATVCFEVLSCFFDHPSIDSTKKMLLHPFGNDVLMFRSTLLANREGPFSGCYWVTSLEWPRMEWITQTSKENSNEPMPHLTTFQNIGGNNRKLSIRQCLSLSNNNECLQQQHCRTTTLLQYPTLIYMIQKNRYKYGGSIINKCLR